MNALGFVKQQVQRHDFLNRLVMATYMNTVHPLAMSSRARKLGLKVDFARDHIDVSSADKVIRTGRRHAIYVQDIIDRFDYYYKAVGGEVIGGKSVVDYSTPKFHKVVDFDLHDVYFSSFAEPVMTTRQYMDFAGLKEGAVVIDLGAYSGLTSIMFREECGESGRVVAVDADSANIAAIHKNFALYHATTGRQIDLVEGAVWIHNDGISFSSEGNMGSSAADFVGNRLGMAALVPSFTLSSIADRFGLNRVDFIKCDVEGAEAVIFEDAAFFARFRPQIIAEVHDVAGEMTTGKVAGVLGRYGYSCRQIGQDGVVLPLLECWPDGAAGV